MQTIFLVWFPGLAALAVAAVIVFFVGAKAFNLITQARAIKEHDELALDAGRALKEVCGSETFDLLPNDVQERVQRKVIEIETTVHKQL